MRTALFLCIGLVLGLAASCGDRPEIGDSCCAHADCAGIEPPAIEGYCCAKGRCGASPGGPCGAAEPASEC